MLVLDVKQQLLTVLVLSPLSMASISPKLKATMNTPTASQLLCRSTDASVQAHQSNFFEHR